MFGIYKAYKRSWELDTTYPLFTTKLQVWLALFAFSSFIVVTIWQAIWGWWSMLGDFTVVEWFAYGLGSIVVFIFFAGGVYSLFKLIRLCLHGWFGQKIPIDSNMPSNVLDAITPIATEANLKECKAIVVKLIKRRYELDKLISDYQIIIGKSEGKNGESKPTNTL